MKPTPGDMVKFNPFAITTPIGSTAVKYFTRIESIVGGQIGIVLEDRQSDMIVLWHDHLIMGIPKKYLEVINEGR